MISAELMLQKVIKTCMVYAMQNLLCLVKAVQELSAKNNDLENRIERLEKLLSASSSNGISALSENPNSNFLTAGVKVYPNPFQSILSIDFSAPGKIQKTISVYNIKANCFLQRLAMATPN